MKLRKNNIVLRETQQKNSIVIHKLGYEERYSKLIMIQSQQIKNNNLNSKIKYKGFEILNKKSQLARAHTKSSLKHKPRATSNSCTNRESQKPLLEGKSKSHNLLQL
jgi:hypothetical protein